MQRDSTAHTQSGPAGDRRRRVPAWLRANATSVLIAVMVFAALFGTRALSIAVADHKDNLLRAQLLVPRAQTEAQSIVAVTQDYVGGLRVQSVAASRIAELRTQLSSDVKRPRARVASHVDSAGRPRGRRSWRGRRGADRGSTPAEPGQRTDSSS